MVRAMSVDWADPRWARRQRWLERFVLALLFGNMLIQVALIWNAWGFEDVNAYCKQRRGDLCVRDGRHG